MAVTREEALKELQRRSGSAPSVTPEQATVELQRRGVIQGEPIDPQTQANYQKQQRVAELDKTDPQWRSLSNPQTLQTMHPAELIDVMKSNDYGTELKNLAKKAMAGAAGNLATPDMKNSGDVGVRDKAYAELKRRGFNDNQIVSALEGQNPTFWGQLVQDAPEQIGGIVGGAAGTVAFRSPAGKAAGSTAGAAIGGAISKGVQDTYRWATGDVRAPQSSEDLAHDISQSATRQGLIQAAGVGIGAAGNLAKNMVANPVKIMRGTLNPMPISDAAEIVGQAEKYDIPVKVSDISSNPVYSSMNAAASKSSATAPGMKLIDMEQVKGLQRAEADLRNRFSIDGASPDRTKQIAGDLNNRAKAVNLALDKQAELAKNQTVQGIEQNIRNDFNAKLNEKNGAELSKMLDDALKDKRKVWGEYENQLWNEAFDLADSAIAQKAAANPEIQAAKETLSKYPGMASGPAFEKFQKELNATVGAVDISAIKQLAQQKLDALAKNKGIGSTAMGEPLLKQIMQLDNSLPFGDAKVLRTALMKAQESMAANKDVAIGDAKQFVKMLTDKMGTTADSLGADVKYAWKTARAFTSMKHDKLEDEMLKSAINKISDNPDAMSSFIFQNNSPERTLQIRKLMGAEKWNEVRSIAADKFLADSYERIPGLSQPVVNGKKLLESLDKTKGSLRVLFTPEQISELTKQGQAMQSLQTKGLLGATGIDKKSVFDSVDSIVGAIYNGNNPAEVVKIKTAVGADNWIDIQKNLVDKLLKDTYQPIGKDSAGFVASGNKLASQLEKMQNTLPILLNDEQRSALKVYARLSQVFQAGEKTAGNINAATNEVAKTTAGTIGSTIAKTLSLSGKISNWIINDPVVVKRIAGSLNQPLNSPQASSLMQRILSASRDSQTVRQMMQVWDKTPTGTLPSLAIRYLEEKNSSTTPIQQEQ